MPPKKRKTGGGRSSTTQYMWLLDFTSGGGYNDLITGQALYSTKDNAIAGLPDLMDAHSYHGDDWKNGLKGFGKEDDDPYLGYDYLGDSVGDEGGELLTNKDSDPESILTVSLKRMQVDPPVRPKSEVSDTEQEEVLAGGLCF